VSVWVALSLLNFKAPHLIPGRSSPAGSVEGEPVGTKLGGSQSDIPMCHVAICVARNSLHTHLAPVVGYTHEVRTHAHYTLHLAALALLLSSAGLFTTTICRQTIY
jgi:hypothetical protein